MFKCCPFVHNVPNGLPRIANICNISTNIITCIDVIAALENSSIIYIIPTCKVLIMTEFNTILRTLSYITLFEIGSQQVAAFGGLCFVGQVCHGELNGSVLSTTYIRLYVV